MLPTPFPNLLVNGSTGIAVGMATSIPPHNMREVIDGVIAVIEQRTAPARSSRDAPAARARARTFRPAAPSSAARASSTPTPRAAARSSCAARRRSRSIGRRARPIVITEIPYQVNKARLVEEIAELVREKHIEGISDSRDESSRDGMRIVIELKRGELPDVVLNNLYKHTKLQTSYGDHAAGDRRRPAARAGAARHRRALHRVPPRSRAAPDRVRAAQGRGARAHPRRSADCARPPRRGDHAHPCVARTRVEARAGLDRRSSGSRSSRRRRSSTCSSSG